MEVDNDRDRDLLAPHRNSSTHIAYAPSFETNGMINRTVEVLI